MKKKNAARKKRSRKVTTIVLTREEWGREDTEELLRLFGRGVPLRSIAATLERTPESVAAKLTRMRRAGKVGRRRPATRDAEGGLKFPRRDEEDAGAT